MTQVKAGLLVWMALALLMSFGGCSEPEPSATACPLPTLPPESTTSTDLTGVPTEATDTTGQPEEESNMNACSGGTLSPSQAYELLGDTTTTVMIIDIRTPSEYAAGHIPDAINMPSSDSAFWDHVRVLPRGGTYFLYCRSGSTTRAVLTQMVKDGFIHACQLGTGFNGWSREGFPVEKGAG